MVHLPGLDLSVAIQVRPGGGKERTVGYVDPIAELSWHMIQFKNLGIADLVNGNVSSIFLVFGRLEAMDGLEKYTCSCTFLVCRRGGCKSVSDKCTQNQQEQTG